MGKIFSLFVSFTLSFPAYLTDLSHCFIRAGRRDVCSQCIQGKFTHISLYANVFVVVDVVRMYV